MQGHASQNVGVRIDEIGKRRFVEFAINPGVQLPIEEILGWQHDIVIGMAGQELGLEHLVVVVGVVANLDAGLFLEVGDRIGRDVIHP